MTRFYDVTLRDGNHAARHSIDTGFVDRYCKAAEASAVWAVEVGHGNGLGASSFLVGKASETDHALLSAARGVLSKVKLAVHSIPGFATVKRDIGPAIDLGVEIVRVGTHVTEVTTARKHLEFITSKDVVAHGVLMMSHSVDVGVLVEQSLLMEQYGASAVIIMDSAGNYTPRDVAERIRALQNRLSVAVGFHAHNNLSIGVANALAAIDEGADIIDGSSMGLGAGAGNASLEAIVVNRRRLDPAAPALQPFIEMSELVELGFPQFLPRTSGASIRSGDAGVFSGFAPQVRQVSDEFGVSQEDLWQELGRRRLVAGQESMIREIAQDLMHL